MGSGTTRRVAAARRRYARNHRPEDLQSHKALSNQLKKEIRRVRRANWRRMLQKLSTDPDQPNKSLFGASEWSRKSAGKPRADPHLPEMRKAEGKIYTADNNEKAEILVAKLSPPMEEADLTDINAKKLLDREAVRVLDIDYKMSEKELQKAVNWLPNNKAPGLDGIMNEVIKIAASSVLKA